jgi:hypothetical protein
MGIKVRNNIMESIVTAKTLYYLSPMVISGVIKREEVSKIHSMIIKKTFGLPKNLKYQTICN